ncbi:MAG: SGNH/GDSL hydrolase family protein [Clostridia bacterium]|nr:SGNH/GDSL hydrolase family protein [Clostridia bacterium]
MKVTIIGDSIAMQYGPKVKDLLDGEFEVWQPDENCRCSKYTLRGLFDWERSMRGSDIVHWNNGHWDLCNLFGDGPFASEEEYVRNMLRILDILQKRHKVIIYATTTPLLKDGYNRNVDVERYNSVIVPLLKERGVIINDLHVLVMSDIGRYIDEEDPIHLNPKGIEVCASQVAEYIRAAAKSIEKGTSESSVDDSETDKTGAPVLI